jgi:phage terminase small subunit
MTKTTKQHLTLLKGGEYQEYDSTGYPLTRRSDLPPPDWLVKDDIALQEWHRLTEILHAERIISTVDLSMLAVTCKHYSQCMVLHTSNQLSEDHLVELEAQYADFFLKPPSLAVC